MNTLIDDHRIGQNQAIFHKNSLIGKMGDSAFKNKVESATKMLAL
jgi:hypothetical protein